MLHFLLDVATLQYDFLTAKSILSFYICLVNLFENTYVTAIQSLFVFFFLF